ncbi:MAG: hypothetical protein HC817_05555 [Saprospiraceae bacterium]|nr:hypothetical protein [Saprospiraceae bacterium]
MEKTLVEIFREISVLQQDLVSADELRMVKNYLLGNMLNTVDGPFAVSDVIKGMTTEGSV